MENAEKSIATARLILDYIRTFIWPLVVVFILLLYKQDVLQLIKTRQIKVAGVFEVGESINDLNANAQAELADLRKFIEEIRASANDPAKVAQLTENLTANVDSLKVNLDKNITQIKRESTQPRQMKSEATAPSAADAKGQAQSLELRGFEALLDRDVDAAIDAFAKAEALWPDYHNVTEIKRLLTRKQNELASAPKEGKSPAWSELYRILISKYSWGMPTAVRTKLHAALD